MSDSADTLSRLVGLLDGTLPGLWPVVRLSIEVSGAATLLAALVALPLAAWLALTPFWKRARRSRWSRVTQPT